MTAGAASAFRSTLRKKVIDMVCLPLEPSSPVPLPFRSVRIGMADHGVMGRSAGPGARAMRSWCSQCAGIAAPRASRALVGLRRSMRSERDTRRRGRDASETGAVDKRVRSARARRSEPAIRRDRREASDPCRSAHTRSHRHGAMRSGSAGDATASPRPPASRADAAVETPAEPRRSMRSERDTRRRGRDASEPARL